MEDDIRKSGMLYIHQQRFGKKWRKAWCVVFADGRCSAARLEVYEPKQGSMTEGSGQRRHDSKKVIRLRDCVRISDKDVSDCPKGHKAFVLETSDKLLLFAAMQSEQQEWVNTLCQLAFQVERSEHGMMRQSIVQTGREVVVTEMKENSLYETADSVRDFRVVVVGTEAAVRCGLRGEFVLTVGSDRLLLKHHGSKDALFTWPYCFIRKFGQDMLIFSFEAGRRCESGEGQFVFATSQSQNIFKCVSAAIGQPHEGVPCSGVPSRNAATDRQNSPKKQAREEDCVYSTVKFPLMQTEPADRAQGALSGPPSCKKLTASFRSLSLNAIEVPTKDQVRSMNSCPPLNTQDQGGVYAQISRPRPKHLLPQGQREQTEGSRSCLQRLGSFPDSPLTCPDGAQLPVLNTVQEEDGRRLWECRADTPDLEHTLGDGGSGPSAAGVGLEEHGMEAIYAEPEEFQTRALWEVLCEYRGSEEHGGDYDGAREPTIIYDDPEGVMDDYNGPQNPAVVYDQLGEIRGEQDAPRSELTGSSRQERFHDAQSSLRQPSPAHAEGLSTYDNLLPRANRQ